MRPKHYSQPAPSVGLISTCHSEQYIQKGVKMPKAIFLMGYHGGEVREIPRLLPYLNMPYQVMDVSVLDDESTEEIKTVMETETYELIGASKDETVAVYRVGGLAHLQYMKRDQMFKVQSTVLIPREISAESFGALCEQMAMNLLSEGAKFFEGS